METTTTEKKVIASTKFEIGLVLKDGDKIKNIPSCTHSSDNKFEIVKNDSDYFLVKYSSREDGFRKLGNLKLNENSSFAYFYEAWEDAEENLDWKILKNF